MMNNLVAQDYWNINRRMSLMLGVKSCQRAQPILADTMLIHMIRKRQYQHP
jgi:transposase-like protein